MHQQATERYAAAREEDRSLPLSTLAVCIAKRAKLEGVDYETGIHKTATCERVSLGLMGLVDDAVVNLVHHGGRDQAVYAFGAEDIAYWEEQRGRKHEPGFMGENLIIANLDTHNVYVGDRYIFPDAVLEATLPRIPCATFSCQMKDKQWVKKFYASGHLGVYFRVLQEGTIGVDDPIKLDTSHTSSKRILDLA